MAEVSLFAGMTGKNRHFRDLSQQVLSGVVDRCFINSDRGDFNFVGYTPTGAQSCVEVKGKGQRV